VEIKDLHIGEIVGYGMATSRTQDLVVRALFRVVAAKRSTPGLVYQLVHRRYYQTPDESRNEIAECHGSFTIASGGNRDRVLSHRLHLRNNFNSSDRQHDATTYGIHD